MSRLWNTNEIYRCDISGEAAVVAVSHQTSRLMIELGGGDKTMATIYYLQPRQIQGCLHTDAEIHMHDNHSL